MKAFAPKSESEAAYASKDRRRQASRHSADEPASRPTAIGDNRPGITVQPQFRARMNRSPRPPVQHLAQLQAMIDTSPRQVAQREQWARMFGQAPRGQAGQSSPEGRDRTEGHSARTDRPLQRSMAPPSTGNVLQRAGTKPNQPSKDGKYRIKLSSEREAFTYENRVALGLDKVLPKHHNWMLYNSNKNEVTDVQLETGEMVYLKEPIPEPTGGKRMLVIDTVGYQAPRDEEEQPPQAKKLFMDIKIGHYTKSGQQWQLEGAGWFMQVLKQVEHDMKDRWRTSREVGYDIDAENVEKFRETHDKALLGQEPLLRAAMMAVVNPLDQIERTMAQAPVTFVGASVFIVLNLTEPGASAVKIIDPDHPIVLDSPQGLGNVPSGVMTPNKMQGGRDWTTYKNKWQQGFGSGMTNFLKWFAYRLNQLPKPL